MWPQGGLLIFSHVFAALKPAHPFTITIFRESTEKTAMSFPNTAMTVLSVILMCVSAWNSDEVVPIAIIAPPRSGFVRHFHREPP